MSKGNRVVSLRLPPDVSAALDEALKRAEWYSRGAPPTVAQWVLTAIRERLAKMERNRKHMQKRSYRRDEK